jgi:hypothetical protein
VSEVCARHDLAGGRDAAKPGGHVERGTTVAVADRDGLACLEADADAQRQCRVGRSACRAELNTASASSPRSSTSSPPHASTPSLATWANLVARREAAPSPCWAVKRV